MRRWLCLLVLLGGLALDLAACRRAPRTSLMDTAPALTGPVFRDTAAEAGIHYVAGVVKRSPLTVLDTAPGGCAWLDLDGDGWLDLVLVAPPRCAVYRNLGGGRFQDVTREVGLERSGRWMGCAVGDFDNDGAPDLLLTGYRCVALFRNDQGRLVDVTRRAGIAADLWTSSAAFADVDGDGWLDLYLGAYVDYHEGRKDLCTYGKGIQTACGPEMYPPERGRLYRNLGEGRFEDITQRAGLGKASGKTWGVAFADYDDDGRPDLYLANDQEPGNLFHNLGQGRFEDLGLTSGTAYDAVGQVQGGMGVDWADYDGDGRLDLFVTTYVYQDKQLYRNEGAGLFRLVSREANIAAPTKPYVGFGCGFLDVNNDTRLDLLIANGHIRDNVKDLDPTQTYPQPLQLLLGQPDGTFRDGSQNAGEAVTRPLVGRGMALGDYDRDGRVDVVVIDLGGAVRLLHNETSLPNHHWISIRLLAKARNLEGIGARVVIEAGGQRQVREVTRGRGVLSASDVAVHFGLAATTTVERLIVRWPDGAREEWCHLVADREQVVRQGTGLTVGKSGG